MRDNFGRTYARLSELKPGDQIIIDDGFAEVECLLPAFSQHTIYAERRTFWQWLRRAKPELYFICAEGHHGLEGQLAFEDTNDDSLVGIYHAEGFQQCQ